MREDVRRGGREWGGESGEDVRWESGDGRGGGGRSGERWGECMGEGGIGWNEDVRRGGESGEDVKWRGSGNGRGGGRRGGEVRGGR